MDVTLSYDELKPLWKKITAQYGHRRFGEKTFESWLDSYGPTLVENGIISKKSKISSKFGDAYQCKEEVSSTLYPSTITVNARLAPGSDIITKLSVPIRSTTWTNDVNSILSSHLGVNGQLVNTLPSPVSFSTITSPQDVSNTVWVFKPISAVNKTQTIHAPNVLRYPKGTFSAINNGPRISNNLIAGHLTNSHMKHHRKKQQYKVNTPIRSELLTKKSRLVGPHILTLPPPPIPMEYHSDKTAWAESWKSAVINNLSSRAGSYLSNLTTMGDLDRLRDLLKESSAQMKTALATPEHALATSSRKRVVWITINEVQHIVEAEAFRSVPSGLLLEADKYYASTSTSRKGITITWGTMLPVIITEKDSVALQEARLLFRDFIRLFNTNASDASARFYLLHLMKEFNDSMKSVLRSNTLKEFLAPSDSNSDSSDSSEEEPNSRRRSTTNPVIHTPSEREIIANTMKNEIVKKLSSNLNFIQMLGKITNSNVPSVINMSNKEDMLMLTQQKIGFSIPKGLTKAAKKLTGKAKTAIDKVDTTLKNNDEKQIIQKKAKDQIQEARDAGKKEMQALKEKAKAEKDSAKAQKLKSKLDKLTNSQITDKERPELVPLVVPITSKTPYTLNFPALIPISTRQVHIASKPTMPALIPLVEDGGKQKTPPMPDLISIKNNQAKVPNRIINTPISLGSKTNQNNNDLIHLEKISYSKQNKIGSNQASKVNSNPPALIDMPVRPPLKKIASNASPTNEYYTHRKSSSESESSEESSSESSSSDEEANYKGVGTKMAGLKIGCTILPEDDDEKQKQEKTPKTPSKKSKKDKDEDKEKKDRKRKRPLKEEKKKEKKEEKEKEEEEEGDTPAAKRRKTRAKIASLAVLGDLAANHNCHIAYNYFHGSDAYTRGVDLNNKVIVLPPARDFSRTTVTRIESSPVFKDQKHKDVVFDLLPKVNVPKSLDDPKITNITGSRFNYSIDNNNFTYKSASMHGAAVTMKIANCSYYEPTNTMYLICSS
jgi:hypothetical protein